MHNSSKYITFLLLFLHPSSFEKNPNLIMQLVFSKMLYIFSGKLISREAIEPSLIIGVLIETAVSTNVFPKLA